MASTKRSKPALVKSKRSVPGTGSGMPPTATKRAYASVKLTMPKWYIDALGAEADRLRWSRGQFLEMLVLRARGELQLTRNPNWPTLKEPKDSGPNEAYLWNCPRDVMDDIDRIKHPGISYSLWLYFAFREWLGHAATLSIGGGKT